jgi:tripartite-type tricarboxylate transporter receptor subunit TctC
MNTGRIVVLMLTLGACACVTPDSAAQNYPEKPIRLILPFAGGTDVVGRVLALKLSPALGQQIVPEPRLGAGGNIAHEAAARAPADGYTLLLAGPPVVMNPHFSARPGYDPQRDFAAITQLAKIPNVLVVHPSVPAKTLAELIQLARSRPDKLSYGSGGVGSANHLAAELLKSLTGTRIVHVPYKSATIALVGAMSGEVDVVIVAASSVVAYARQGRIRPLVVLDAKHVSSLPDVPTAGEVSLPQLVVVNWYLLLAPAATPRAIIERLNTESVRAMAMPDTIERLATLGGEPFPGTPDQATEFLRTEYARWGKVIREAAIKAE